MGEMAELAPGAKRATLLTFIGCLISCLTFALFLFASWPTTATTKFENNHRESGNNNKIHLVQQFSKDASTPTSGWLVFDTETEERKRVSSSVVLESISEQNSSKIGAKYKQQKQPLQSEQFDEEWVENLESFRESSSDSVAALVAASGGGRRGRRSNSGSFESLRSSQEKSAKLRGEENVKEEEEEEEEAKRKDRRKRSVSGVEQKESANRKKRRLESKYQEEYSCLGLSIYLSIHTLSIDVSLSSLNSHSQTLGINFNLHSNDGLFVCKTCDRFAIGEKSERFLREREQSNINSFIQSVYKLAITIELKIDLSAFI